MFIFTTQKNTAKTVPASSTARGRAGSISHKSFGFTLVELMVSISIFAVITAVVLIRNNEFNSGILFSNMVYEIALSIREMQTYGITVRASDTGTFQNGYGVYFNSSETEKNSLVQFTDIPNVSGVRNQSYDNPAEKLFKLNLKPGNFIEEIKVCDSGNVCSQVSEVAITYVRPEPDATIKSGVTTYTRAGITVRAPGNDPIVRKCIVVTSVGQISVQTYNGTSCIQ